ncbi:sodium-dependent bicarbonate transport family permease [Arsenicitalea aurantiaca]|uniref:Sodium-dependent bicarbonate transport family permease n=1 Tax=Arsenicitalea aurantiaca TaxID=1783274 RepID=A0A433XEC3_9HYPH|nr:sodium-dependent bicarbonate transport family permease [Arsenicitalea aurantiaca]RUT32455.1 sodium-dependent bicarbonate transport family permease [Arsenicitalea aurantiaca]
MDILLSPIILFFLLGAVAALIRSDLAVPEVVGKALALYLMAAIGLKGGVQVSETGFTQDLLVAGLAGVALSFLLPLPAFFCLTRFGRLGPVDAGAVSAHYGSVSVVTFVAGAEILTGGQMPPAGYMVAVLALMETPGILTGLWLAGRAGRTAPSSAAHAEGHLREALTNGSVVLLVGSFIVGLVVGSEGFAPVAPVFEGAFRGMLCLFLLDMGLVAARHLMRSRSLTPALIGLAIGFPLVNGTIGVAIGTLVGLDTGSAAALGVLAGSASYIAAPAAIRLALPSADIGLPLAMSLGITFPFNVLVGIPTFAALARWMA